MPAVLPASQLNPHSRGLGATLQLTPTKGRTAHHLASRVIQCQFKTGTHVRINDNPPCYGQIVSADGVGNYQVRIGGTNNIRRIEEHRLSLHPMLLAQKINVPALIAPSRFEVGTHVKVNDNPPWHGQITDWNGRGIYQVRVGGMALIKNVEERKLELHSIVATMKKFVRPEFATGTYVKVNSPNSQSWYGKITGWDGKGKYTVEVSGSSMKVQVEAEKIESHPVFNLVTLRNATYIGYSEACKLNPNTTLVLRAQNTGDMYHIKASMAIHSDFNLLLWNVNQVTRSQAQQVVDLLGDLVNRPDTRQQIFYMHVNLCPNKLYKNETWATSDIEAYLDRPSSKLFSARQSRLNQLNSLKSKLGEATLKRLMSAEDALKEANKESRDVLAWARESHRRLLVNDLSRRFAFYTEAEAMAFESDLQSEGRFEKGKKYVIVNFRATGHSNRPGANAPALDTGRKGMQQIIEAVKQVLGHEVVVVPMGEEPMDMIGKPNLLCYWTWPSAGNRRTQAALLRYLNDNYNIVGAIGMRSGVMDQIAFAGIKIISIDISPHRYEGELPDLARSKGWDRGMKLEKAYRGAYGRVFLTQPRKKESERNLPDWKGKFHPHDVANIKSAVGLYFSGASGQSTMHSSHPLYQNVPEQALERFKQTLMSKPLTAYNLIDNIHPYISQLYNFRNSISEKAKGEVEQLRRDIEAKIKEVEKNASQLITWRFRAHNEKTIKWMRDNQQQALLRGETQYKFYREQVEFVAKEFGLIGQEETAIKIYRAYDEKYRQLI